MRAVEYLIRSAAHYDLAEMPLRAHLLRYRLGEIVAGPETRALHETGRAMDQGAGDRLAGAVGRDVCPGLREDRRRIDRDDLLRLAHGATSA